MNALHKSAVNLVRYQGAADPDHNLQGTSKGHLSARLALDNSTRTHAFSIRHKSYLTGGYIDRRPDGQFSDPNDEMPNSHTMVVYRDARPAASIRFCVLDTDPTLYGWDDIPAAHIFPEEVKALLALKAVAAASHDGRPVRAAEINRLVRHPDYADDRELVFVLFRLATYLIRHFEPDVTLSCVRRNHMPFYQRTMNFKNVAGPRRYDGVKFETHLMACDRSRYNEVARDVPIFNSSKITAGGYDGLFRGETVDAFGEV